MRQHIEQPIPFLPLPNACGRERRRSGPLFLLSRCTGVAQVPWSMWPGCSCDPCRYTLGLNAVPTFSAMYVQVRASALWTFVPSSFPLGLVHTRWGGAAIPAQSHHMEKAKFHVPGSHHSVSLVCGHNVLHAVLYFSTKQGTPLPSTVWPAI